MLIPAEIYGRFRDRLICVLNLRWLYIKRSMCVILFFPLSDIELIYFLGGVCSELSVLLYDSNKFREEDVRNSSLEEMAIS